MIEIGSLGYPVFIGGDVPRRIADFLGAREDRATFVLYDRNVVRRAREVAAALAPLGPVDSIGVRLSERRKTLRTLESVLGELARRGADRRSLVVGVGGGVATDLFGFAAAVYMRGVDFLAVSTTLVGMADAAIGGKTGVDLAAGKNLAGVFRDPVAVFDDLDALRTLRTRHLREGLAEIVKAAIIAGPESLTALENLAGVRLRAWPWADIVARAVHVKCEIVAADRLESGRRELLNLGHTFAHGFERASGYLLSHGEAVAVGLRAAGLLSLRLGSFSLAEHKRVTGLLHAAGLRTTLPRLDERSIFEAMKTDKKARAGALRFTLPRALGRVEFGIEAPREQVLWVLRELRTRDPARD